MAAARWRWKPPQPHVGVTTTDASHTVNAPSVRVPAETLTTNHTAYRTPLSRPKAVYSLVRSVGDRTSRRGGVLTMAGLPARSHPGGSVQSLVDGMLITVLGIFIVVVVAAVWLSRRRRRSVAASRSYDEYVDDDDDCVELGEFVNELDDWSHDDAAETTRHETSSPMDWILDDGLREDDGQFIADSMSLVPLCARSTSSAASSVASISTPSDTPLYWQIPPA